MSILKIILKRKEVDFQRCDTDFEIMQVNTQMICNGWERIKKEKDTEKKIQYHHEFMSVRLVCTTCTLGRIIIKNEKEILKLIKRRERKDYILRFDCIKIKP